MNWLPFHIFMGILGAAACWLIYLMARLLLGEIPARFTALWLAFYPPQMFWSTRMNPRSIASHLLVLSAFAIIFERRGSIARTFGLGVLWGVLTLFRGEYLLAALLISMYFFWVTPTASKKTGVALCFLVGFTLTIAPWMARNWRLHHKIVFATNLGDNLYHAFNPRYDFTGIRHDQNLWNQMPGKTEIEIQDCYIAQAMTYIRSSPWVLPRTLGGNVFHFWRPYLSPRAVSWKENVLYVLSYGPVFLFFLIGIFKIPWKRPEWALVGGIVAYQCLIHLPFYIVVNFREMIAPFLILIASAGVSMTFFQHSKEHGA